ncbi:lactate dehydrogenase-like 2-hydroxyacid dehydrogenase [Scopulibacillus darangshiensis]|uniref:Lactate dehydrogenase-like 2-hydroxyacid dehydrogenase n=1 Tax=Scopulibacillus darangshiensis TaxID=442528 RepID=A0A4R2NY76_9BACL|nr:D-glycerate dehydrogenase [Scopulibacillus darangshiensis]TCP26574.1 lactate dehydrogenase-like 2-hydroxyacid dehydrogenase [Scopulibacillus darangshiensis]
MNKPKVYITRKCPEDSIKRLKNIANIKMWTDELEPVPRDILLNEVKDVDAVLTTLSEDVDESFFSHANKLKVVGNLAVGYDNIDVKAAERHGITITNTPDVLTETTADLAFALMMAVARRIVEASDYVKKGQWKNWGPLLLAGKDLHHKTIGIVGMGRIGTALARRAKGFDMDILYHNRSRDEMAEKTLGAVYAPFEDVLEAADYVVCLTPLTAETKGLFDGKAFELMKQDAIFVNVSRGPVVDEQSLYKALVGGKIAGAGLDVFEKEPISSDHPLLSLDQVVALPHIGSSSMATRYKMIDLACWNIAKILEGKPAVTPVKSRE